MDINNLGEDLKSDGEVLDMVYDWAEANPRMASELKEILVNQQEHVSDGFVLTIKIDKDIPIPPKKKQAPSRKYKGLSDAIRTLEINDSFFIPIPDNMSAKSFRDTIFSRVSLIKKKRKDKLSLTTREVDDGIRVWRIA